MRITRHLGALLIVAILTLLTVWGVSRARKEQPVTPSLTSQPSALSSPASGPGKPIPPPPHLLLGPTTQETADAEDLWPRPYHPEWTRIVERGDTYRDVEILRNGRWLNLTNHDRPQNIHDYGVSSDRHWLFVWHSEYPPRRLGIYDLQSLGRKADFVPGFGGSILWTPYNTLLHHWGCGSPATMWRIYDTSGRTLAEQFACAISVAPSVRYLLSFPAITACKQELQLVNLRDGHIAGRRRPAEQFWATRVRWDDEAAVVDYSFLGVKDDWDSARDGQLRVPLPNE